MLVATPQTDTPNDVVLGCRNGVIVTSSQLTRKDEYMGRNPLYRICPPATFPKSCPPSKGDYYHPVRHLKEILRLMVEDEEVEEFDIDKIPFANQVW